MLDYQVPTDDADKQSPDENPDNTKDDEKDSGAADSKTESAAKPITREECTWAIHPGGPMILRAIIDALGIEHEQTTSSWDVLQRFGNLSSATLIFVYDALRKRKDVKGGTWIPSLAFGPGLNVEGTLLRTVGEQADGDQHTQTAQKNKTTVKKKDSKQKKQQKKKAGQKAGNAGKVSAKEKLDLEISAIF